MKRRVDGRDGRIEDRGVQPGTGLFLFAVHGWEQNADGVHDIFLGEYPAWTKREAREKAQMRLDRWRQGH
jgi:hypothetical protein